MFSIEPSLLARIDKWRGSQVDVPSRALEAVRRLVKIALPD